MVSATDPHLRNDDTDGMAMPSVQLRIDFPQPETAVTIGVTLRGLLVSAAVWEGDVGDAASYLQSAGMHVRVEAGQGIAFPLADLRHIASLPAQVRLEPLGAITPLVHYARSRSSAPATVTGTGRLHLTWYDGATRREETLDDEAAAALAVTQLPFVATEEAWARLSRLSGLPMTLGQAQVNLDGFIELSSSHPQNLEAAPIPGLFRIDSTHFGMSIAYRDALDTLRGIEWVGSPPRITRPPSIPTHMDSFLSEHLRSDLRDLVARMACVQGQVLVYKPGLGRRILALAALESFTSFPALVVCPPWGLWVWQRNADLMGKTVSLSDSEADIRLLTYLDLSLKPRLAAYEAIIFDDLGGPDARVPSARSAMAGLSVMDAYRIGICSSWPEDPEEGCSLLEMVRPGEFTLDDQPLAMRYPLRPVQRAEEHAEPYLMRRDSADASVLRRVRRHEVLVVPASDEQLRAARAPQPGPMRKRLADACELASSGTPSSVSPKIAHAHQLVAAAHAERRRIVLATRSRRSATLLRATLASFSPAMTDESFDASSAGPVTVCLWSRRLPDLRVIDEVVLIDYPWSTAVIEDAVGPAGLEHGPRQVAVMHSPGLVDDRLSVYAARRRELGSADDPSAPPEDDEIDYLLARRWG